MFSLDIYAAESWYLVTSVTLISPRVLPYTESCKSKLSFTPKYHHLLLLVLVELILWAPLNGITLGQRETDNNNRLILISESTKHTLGRKW